MTAILSACGQYRYRLERDVDLIGRTIAFIGVNPSTADAMTDDATVRKWRGFAERMGARRFVVGNLFAFRATDVTELARVADPIGPDNDEQLRALIGDADVVVPCWGSGWKLPQRLRPRITAVREILRHCGRPIHIFGLTASGDPKHVLMLGYGTPLAEWVP